MSALAGNPPAWNGTTKLVIGAQIQTEGCPVKVTNTKAATKQDGDVADLRKR